MNDEFSKAQLMMMLADNIVQLRQSVVRQLEILDEGVSAFVEYIERGRKYFASHDNREAAEIATGLVKYVHAERDRIKGNAAALLEQTPDDFDFGDSDKLTKEIEVLMESMDEGLKTLSRPSGPLG